MYQLHALTSLKEGKKMLKEEFERRIGETVSDDAYKEIEYVYEFHPSISETCGKDQIATIWMIGKGRIIKDMMNTAREAERIETEIRRTNSKLESLKKELRMLKRGETNV